MGLALQLLAYLTFLYLLVLLARVVFDVLQMISRSWRPTGWVTVIANLVYGLTDPPLRQLSRWIKPLPMGGVSLDLGFLILFVATGILHNVLFRAALQV